jgi:hypothetical protein
MTPQEQQAAFNKTLETMNSLPEIAGVFPSVRAQNYARYDSFFQATGLPFTPENLVQIREVALRNRWLITPQMEIDHLSTLKTADMRRALESEQPYVTPQITPNGEREYQVNQDGTLVRPYSEAMYQQAMLKLNRDAGCDIRELARARFDEARNASAEEIEEGLRDVIDTMIQQGDPVSAENAIKWGHRMFAARGVESGPISPVTTTPGPMPGADSPLSTEYFLNNAPTSDVGEYFRRQAAQEQSQQSDGVETVTTEQLRERFMGPYRPDPSRPYR